jgi:pyruvate/2-oxoglutarate dehydrogenase complex dihydrolipoamide acyltransferase (E2) component
MLLLSLPLLAACATTAPTAPVATTPAPTDTVRKTAVLIPAEDLTKYRPTFAPAGAAPAPSSTTAAPRPATPPAPKTAPAPTNAVTAQVEQRLRDQAFTNQNVKYTSGYRVRAYLGLERAQAMTVRRQVIGRYPEETDYITFKQPVYRLYIGDYTSKLEAVRGLARVRQFAPKAELEPMQVLLNKTP